MDLHIRRLFQSIWAGAGGRADVIAKILHSGCERQKKDRCNALPSILPLCPPGLISVVPFHPSYLVSPYILCFIISLCYFIDTFIRLLFYMQQCMIYCLPCPLTFFKFKSYVCVCVYFLKCHCFSNYPVNLYNFFVLFILIIVHFILLKKIETFHTCSHVLFSTSTVSWQPILFFVTSSDFY